VVEGVDEIEVALEGAEAADEAEEGGIDGEAGFAAGLIPGAGLEAGGIDAVDNDVDQGGWEAVADEAVPEGVGDGVDAADPAVEKAADEAAMGGELRGGELGVLSVEDGDGGGGEDGVDERAEVMGVDNVRGQPADVAGEGGDGGWREAVTLAEDVDLGGIGEALEEWAGLCEAADVDVEFREGKSGG
jgi:hypothetical protein